MKYILTSSQLEMLKNYLFENKTVKKTDSKTIDKIKIENKKQLEDTLIAVGQHNKGLKIPTNITQAYVNEVKFPSSIVRTIKNRIVKIIKDTCNSSDGEKQSVFYEPKKSINKSNKYRPKNLKTKLKKIYKINLGLPIKDIDLSNDIVHEFLVDISQNYSSDIILKRSSGGSLDISYGM
jgi:hypothetical protein